MLGLPRGGVVVAAAVAEALGAPHDVVLVRKVGVPAQPELAMGAIGEGDVRVVNDDVVSMARVTPEVFERVAAAERAELDRRAERYREGRPMAAVAGKTAIVVDDGVATGATARAALIVVRAMEPAHLVLGTPVAAADTVRMLATLADEIVVVDELRHMTAVGASYRHFDQTTDAEVVDLLQGAP